jgi:hypothetical protein
MKLICLIIPFSIFFTLSCKSPQQAQEPPAPPITANTSNDAVIVNNGQAEVASNPGQNMQTSKDTRYRFIISLISIGEGTDRNAKEILDATLNSWKTSQKKEIVFEEIHWGREGEVDFCFQLKELSGEQQVQFMNELKEKFKGHDLVQFAENEPCAHKR